MEKLVNSSDLKSLAQACRFESDHGYFINIYDALADRLCRRPQPFLARLNSEARLQFYSHFSSEEEHPLHTRKVEISKFSGGTNAGLAQR